MTDINDTANDFLVTTLTKFFKDELNEGERVTRIQKSDDATSLAVTVSSTKAPGYRWFTVRINIEEEPF